MPRPPARDLVAILADGHITSADPERVETLVQALDRLAERCSAVYILGDSFEVWLGVRAREEHVARVGAALGRLRAAGVRTAYVEGNRDFCIGRGATAGLFDVVAPRELIERHGEVTLHLSHGDLVNPRDWPYRCWRAFAKSVLAPVGLRVLPDRIALALAARLEGDLRTTNRKHKAHFPEPACVAYAQAKIAAGADLVVVGHFHREVILPVVAGGRKGTFVSLPFWHQEPRPLFFDRTGGFVD